MENFIGNNAKFIIEWGQMITLMIIVLSAFTYTKWIKKNKYFLPKRFLGYLGTIVLLIATLISSFAFKKVTDMKPRISTVIYELESLHNNPAPAFEMNLLENDIKKNITDYKGQLVLLNYWATWCKPCLKEMPELSRLQEKYKNQGLMVIALSDEDKGRLLKFTLKRPLAVTVAYSKTFTWGDIQTERPMTFLINKDGVIVNYFTGGYDFEFFESKIIQHL